MYHSVGMRLGMEEVEVEEQREGMGAPWGVGSVQTGVAGGYPGG